MKHIGRSMLYEVHNGEQRMAKVNSIEYHQGLKKWLFIGVSPYGHTVRLTKDEILKFA